MIIKHSIAGISKSIYNLPKNRKTPPLSQTSEEHIQRLISGTARGRISNFESVLNEFSSFSALNFDAHAVTLFDLVIIRDPCLLLETLEHFLLQAPNKIFQSH
uniref:Uncharacterized protein n=1 Tax=Daucus carota subsp. sativus TaxID=79200 RepID=A0A161ZNW5_DAUCS